MAWQYRTNRYYTKISPQKEVKQYTDNELADPTLLSRFETVLSSTDSAWEKEFVSSISTHFKHKSQLTNAQYNTFSRIEEKYSAVKIAEKEAFASIFTQEMRANMKNLALIYRKSNSLFFTVFIEKILSNETFIPTKQEWDKFMENDYARGYLENVNSAPKFNQQDIVVPRTGKNNPCNFKYAIVVEVNNELPSTYAAGGKKYSLLPFGASSLITVEERYLKQHKK